MPLKPTTIHLLCFMGISGSGSTQLRNWLEYENEKYDLCEEEKWTSFSFDEIDVPSRHEEKRISKVLKNLKKIINMIFIDDIPIRSDSRLEEVLTIENFYYWFEKCNSSFHDCIEALLYNKDCLNIQQEELSHSNFDKNEISEEIDLNIWIYTLQPYILEIIKKIFDTTCEKFIFDIGSVFYPEKILSVIENYILDEKKILEIQIIQIESDYRLILNRWINEVTNKDDGIPSENYSIYKHDNIRNIVIEMTKCKSYRSKSEIRKSGIERNDEYLRIRFLNSINEIKKDEMLLERLKRFIFKALKDEINQMKELNNNLYWIRLQNQNRIHVIENDDELDEFYKSFICVVDELYGKRVKDHGVLQYVSDDEEEVNKNNDLY